MTKQSLLFEYTPYKCFCIQEFRLLGYFWAFVSLFSNSASRNVIDCSYVGRPIVALSHYTDARRPDAPKKTLPTSNME